LTVRGYILILDYKTARNVHSIVKRSGNMVRNFPALNLRPDMHIPCGFFNSLYIKNLNLPFSLDFIAGSTIIKIILNGK